VAVALEFMISRTEWQNIWTMGGNAYRTKLCL